MSEADGTPPAGGTANDGSRGRSWLLVVLAVVVVVAGVLVGRALWGGASQSTGTSSTPAATTSQQRGTAADCPSSQAVADAVPATPSGVEAGSSLVPGTAPDAAVVCRYDVVTNADFAPPTDGRTPPAPRTPPYPLTGSRSLPSDLARLAADLSLVASGSATGRPCTMMAGPSSFYLLGLSYGTGRVWVALQQEVNRCTGATNGAFSTSVYLGDVVAKAYDTGAWTGWAAQETSCAAAVVGRSGADRELVPGDPSVLTVCEHASNPDQPVSSDTPAPSPRVKVLRGAEMEPVLRSLRALPATALDTQPACPGGLPRASYDVLVSYPAGPAVRVTVAQGCTPGVVSDTLQAPTADDVVAAIRTATGW